MEGFIFKPSDDKKKPTARPDSAVLLFIKHLSPLMTLSKCTFIWGRNLCWQSPSTSSLLFSFSRMACLLNFFCDIVCNVFALAFGDPVLLLSSMETLCITLTIQDFTYTDILVRQSSSEGRHNPTHQIDINALKTCHSYTGSQVAVHRGRGVIALLHGFTVRTARRLGSGSTVLVLCNSVKTGGVSAFFSCPSDRTATLLF